MGAARANDLHGSPRGRLRPAHRLWQRAAEGEHCHQLQGRSEVRPAAAACLLPPRPHLRVAPLARSYEVWQHSAEKETREYINGKHQRKRGRSLQDGASLFPENAWVHVAVVHGGDGTATLFLNGSLCARGPVALPTHVPRGAYLDYPHPSPHQPPPLRFPPHHHLRTLPPAAFLACRNARLRGSKLLRGTVALGAGPVLQGRDARRAGNHPRPPALRQDYTPPPSPASLAPPFLLISLRASASCHPCTRPSLSHMPRAVTPFLHLAKVFNYALSRSELSSCAYSRTLPSGGRAAPLMSFASSWREVRGPVTRHGPNDHGPKPKWLWATLAQYDNLARGWGVGGGSRMCATRGVTCAMCGAPMLHYT